MTTQTKTKTTVKTLKFIVPIIVEPDTIGFHSYSPALKGLHMDGDTEEEALENARLGAKDHIEVMIENNLPIPLCLMTGKHQTKTNAKGYYEEEIIVNY